MSTTPSKSPGMEPGWGFGRVTVINCRSRTDRLEAFNARWERTVLAGLPLQVFTAIENRADGLAGCTASHLEVLTQHHSPVLILEDDAVFSSTFPWVKPPPPDWAVLWLGGQHIAAPRAAPPGWVVPVELMRTHAYVARNPIGLAARFRSMHAPRIDPYLARVPVTQYAVQPQTAGQAGGASDTGGPPRGSDEFWHLRGP